MNPYLLVASLGVLASTAYGLYYHGYKTAANEYELKALQQQKTYSLNIQEIQNSLYETERAWLEQEAKTEVIYRDKIKTVTRTVEKFITDNSLDSCRIGTNGMQQLNEAIRASKGEDK